MNRVIKPTNFLTDYHTQRRKVMVLLNDLGEEPVFNRLGIKTQFGFREKVLVTSENCPLPMSLTDSF